MLLVGYFAAFAQNDMKPLTDEEAFKKKMATEAQKVNTIECDFTQVKHMVALAGDIVSKGKFYYRKEDKVSLDYITPIKYLIVINGSKIKMVSNGKTNTFDVASNGLMKEMKDVISACMTGNLSAMSGNYKMEYYQNSKEYLVKIFPLNESAKAILDGVNIYLDENDLSVTRLQMIEASKDKKAKDKDYTEYQFSDKKLNVDIPESRFAVK
jgi:outer membrane lipoprotein-sorting protein